MLGRTDRAGGTRARLVLIAGTLLLALAVAASFATGTGSARPAGAAGRLFTSTFNACNYAGWELQGAPDSFQSVRSPVVEGACAAAVVLGPDSAGKINSTSDGAMMWLRPNYGANGAQTWQRFFVQFPQDFRPTRGDWNWISEWHNDDGYIPFYQAGKAPWEFANLSWTVRNWRKPRLALRVLGGQTTAPRQVWSNVPMPLKLGHWYDILVHVAWSPDPAAGHVDWWVDGRRILSVTTPTLYTRPDGSISTAFPELGYYRIHADFPARVLFDSILIGTTAASVCAKESRPVPACPANAFAKLGRQPG